MSKAPRYRADIKGQVADIKRDCLDAMRAGIQHADDFIFTAEDCPCYAEYADYLTARELEQLFQQALRGNCQRRA